jgi:hypothetical protein
VPLSRLQRIRKAEKSIREIKGITHSVMEDKKILSDGANDMRDSRDSDVWR